MQYPEDETMRVSHETIYRSLFIQARGVLKQELIGHLRTKRRIRRSRHSRDSGHHSGQIVDAISIRERPAEIEDRAIPGVKGGAEVIAVSCPALDFARGNSCNTSKNTRSRYGHRVLLRARNPCLSPIPYEIS
jgi:hypothetical protein